MKKNSSVQLINLIKQHEIDIVLLCEMPDNFSPNIFLEQLNSLPNVTYYQNTWIANRSRNVLAISKFTSPEFEFVDKSKFINTKEWLDQLSYFQLNLPHQLPITIGLAHLLSKIKPQAELLTNAQELAKDIERFEKQVGHKRTLLVGDFNANPFDDIMLRYDAFKTTMEATVALSHFAKTQTTSSSDYNTRTYFYNPSWSLLGDLHKKAAGTYYYKPWENADLEEHVKNNGYCLHWNLFDYPLLRPDLIPSFEKEHFMIVEQVLRPDLIPFFEKEHFMIVEQDNNNNYFLTEENKNNPQQSTSIVLEYSDHLPIVFSLKF